MLLTYIKQYYFVVFIAIAAMVYTAQRLSIDLPSPIDNYLNDLLCMPIVLKICQFAVRYIKSDSTIQIPIKIALTLTILYSVYFELLLPISNERYTGDWIDVCLYSLGFLFFIWIERVDAQLPTS